MKKYFLLPLLLAVLLLFFMVTIGGKGKIYWEQLYHFFDIPTIAFTFLISFLVLLSFYSPKEILSSYKHSLDSTESSEKDIKKSLQFFSSLQKIVITLGILGTFIGLSLTFNSKSIYNIGISLSFFAIIYSMFILLFFVIPFYSALKKKE